MTLNYDRNGFTCTLNDQRIDDDPESSVIVDDETDRHSMISSLTGLEDVQWYHGEISRNTAEALLLTNGVEGTYLLRKSEHKPGKYAVSVSYPCGRKVYDAKQLIQSKCHDSIKHYALQHDPVIDVYSFGIGQFDSLNDLLDHFKCLPVLGGETGASVTLRYPYDRNIPEPKSYEKVVRHAECGKVHASRSLSHALPDLHIASKEGFLVKQGAIRKSWKKRWFVLQKNTMKYYAEKEKSVPIREIDITEASVVALDKHENKINCFRLALPWRTFYFVAGTPEEAKEWVDILQWKIDYYSKRRAMSDPSSH